jgi:hypothetical protein
MTIYQAHASLPAEPASGRVIYLPWESYLRWHSGRLKHAANASGQAVDLPPPWPPGVHKALIGTTGDGKTTHAVGILGTRKYVLALDPKGEDETLAASGYVRVTSLPQDGWRGAVSRLRGNTDQRAWNDIYERIDGGGTARVIIGGGASSDAEDYALQQLMRDAITFCRHSPGWTLYVDEFELLSSQRMFKLGPLIERMLITARRAKTSVVTSFQAPAWVSKHATRQARDVVMWPIGDPDMIKLIAQGMGRDWREVAEAADLLPKWHTMTIPRSKLGGPLIITRAPKLDTAARASREKPR